MTLTSGLRSNLTLLMDSSDAVSYNIQCISYAYLAPVRCFRLLLLCSMYFLCKLFDLDLTLKANVTYLIICISESIGAYPHMHIKYTQEKDYSHNYSFIQTFNIAIFNILQYSVTLRMMSKSNCLYVTKVLVKTIIWHFAKDAVVKSH